LFEGSDACVAPVLSMDEAPQHAHAQARQGFVTLDGITQPAAAPRFDRSVPPAPTSPPEPGAHTDALLAEAGFSHEQIAALRAAKVVA
jgi:alpha-methylacyl-CoA racemase